MLRLHNLSALRQTTDRVTSADSYAIMKVYSLSDQQAVICLTLTSELSHSAHDSIVHWQKLHLGICLALTLLCLPASWLHPRTGSKALGSLTAPVHCAGAKLPRVAEPSGEAYVQAVTTLLPYLLSHRSRLAAFTASQPVPSNTASTTATTAGQAASAATATATATSRLATASSASTTDRAEPATADSAWATSDFGQASGGSPSTSSYGRKGQEEEAPGSPVRSRPQEFLASLQVEQRHRLVVLVDTAILKVPPTLAGQLLRTKALVPVKCARSLLAVPPICVWHRCLFTLVAACCCWFVQL